MPDDIVVLLVELAHYHLDPVFTYYFDVVLLCVVVDAHSKDLKHWPLLLPLVVETDFKLSRRV